MDEENYAIKMWKGEIKVALVKVIVKFTRYLSFPVWPLPVFLSDRMKEVKFIGRFSLQYYFITSGSNSES